MQTNATLKQLDLTGNKGLTWEDILPVLEQVDTVEELREALADPEAFFEKLSKAGGPVAKKLLIAKVRPVAEPRLEK